MNDPEGNDIGEKVVLARKELIEHSDCGDDLEDYVFLMRQGDRQFPIGLRTILACLAFAEYEGAVPKLPDEWWNRINNRYQ